jgi:hypothetical protein
MDELITFSPPIDPSTWQINSLPKINKRQSRLWNHEDICQAGVVEYEKELTHWTRYLPPGISHSYTIQVSSVAGHIFKILAIWLQF